MLSQSCQYKVKARITLQTTLLEQILHKPSLFFEKRRFLNFQNQPSKIGGRPKADSENSKNIFFFDFSLSALGRPTPQTGGLSKAGIRFWKAGFEN